MPKKKDKEVKNPLDYSTWKKYILKSIGLDKWTRTSVFKRLKQIKSNYDMSFRIYNYPEYVDRFLTEIDKALPMEDQQFKAPVTSTTTAAQQYVKRDKRVTGTPFPHLNAQPIEKTFGIYDFFQDFTGPILSLALGLLLGYFSFNLIKKALKHNGLISRIGSITEYIQAISPEIESATNLNVPTEL